MYFIYLNRNQIYMANSVKIDHALEMHLLGNMQEGKRTRHHQFSSENKYKKISI